MQNPVIMKMKTQLASLLVLLAGTGPLLSATEVERLRALCSEQEMQIRQLEQKISRLTDTPPPARKDISARKNSQPTAGGGTYTIVAGDTIERISRKTGHSVPTLTRLNGIEAYSIIHPGQKLRLPGSSDVVKNTPQSNAPRPSSASTYKVQSGDTFYRISRKYGVSVNQLIATNPGVNHNALRVGQAIKIPSNQVTQAPAPKPKPSLSSSPSVPVSNAPAPAPLQKPRASDKPVRIDKEITYGDFATKHATSTQRLDELNGLELDPTTVLATGSELYIPAQP